MAYYVSNQLTGVTTASAKTGVVPIITPPPTSPAIGRVVVVQATIIFPNGTNPAANDVIEMLTLPADHVPVDFDLVCDDFDSNGTPTIACKVGLLTGTPGDSSRVIGSVGTELLAAASTTLQAAAAVRHPISAAQAAAFRQIAPSTSDRSIAIGISAAAATNIAASRRIDLTVAYRWSRYGA